MKKTIKVLKDSETQETYISLDEFKDIIDLEGAEFYEIEEIDDNGNTSLLVTFYDKDKKQIGLKDD